MQRLLLLFTLAMPVWAQTARTPTLLDGMRDHARPVLIFGSDHEPRVAQQYAELIRHDVELKERDVTIIFVSRSHVPDSPDNPPLGTVAALPAEQAALRRQFHVAPSTFAVILVGKDGGEKYRSAAVVPFKTLAGLIDAMPMRRQEMHAQ